MTMIREKRQSRILELLKQEQLVTIQGLSQQLGVSYMTITRDLGDLENHGLLQRIRGGAIPAAKDDLEIASLPSFLYNPRLDPHSAQKIAIGRYAAENLVEDGDYITIEAGSTASHMVPFLKQSNLTILTNGLLPTMLAAPYARDLTLICSGGILIETGAFIGPQAEDFFSKYRVRKVFVGAQGLTVEDGFTDQTPLYTRLKNAMKQNTDKVIVLIDSSKFGSRSLVQVMALSEADVVVTDSGAPVEIAAALRRKGVDLRIAQPEPSPSPV